MDVLEWLLVRWMNLSLEIDRRFVELFRHCRWSSICVDLRDFGPKQVVGVRLVSFFGSLVPLLLCCWIGVAVSSCLWRSRNGWAMIFFPLSLLYC